MANNNDIEYFKKIVAFEYKGIVFDDFEVDENGVWGEMCQCCAEKYKDLLRDELSDGGMGACSVKGCNIVAADTDYEYHYYIDFKPELIMPLGFEALYKANKHPIAVLQQEINDLSVQKYCFDVWRDAKSIKESLTTEQCELQHDILMNSDLIDNRPEGFDWSNGNYDLYNGKLFAVETIEKYKPFEHEILGILLVKESFEDDLSYLINRIEDIFNETNSLDIREGIIDFNVDTNKVTDIWSVQCILQCNLKFGIQVAASTLYELRNGTHLD